MKKSRQNKLRSCLQYIGAAVVVLLGLVLLFAVIDQFLGNRAEIEDTNEIYVNTFEIYNDLYYEDTEFEYVEAMTETSNYYSLNDLWDGIDKGDKQQVWYHLEDLRGYLDECEDIPYCDDHSDLKEFIEDVTRGAETEIKAYEEWEKDNITEGNNLFTTASEIYGDADVYSYLSRDELKYLTSSQENDIIDALFIRSHRVENSITSIEELCPDISYSFRGYTRYTNACGDEAKEDVEDYLAGINELREIDPFDDYKQFPSLLQSMCWTEVALLDRDECDSINELYEDYRRDILAR